MSDKADLNDRSNRQGQFTQGVGGWAEYTVQMTEIEDKVRHDVAVPPGKVIPIIFLPGVMGSNLRLSKLRQAQLKRDDNRCWRPDDLLTKMGNANVATGTDLGGWLKNASPGQRQANFDPAETEVDYYHYTESKNRFDPVGKETLASDARHQNVPDDLQCIPPLLGHPSLFDVHSRTQGTARQGQSPAQVARWRGWSEILFLGSYSEVLKTTEAFMNNITRGKTLQTRWQINPTTDDGKPVLAPANRSISKLLRSDPTAFGAEGAAPLTEEEIKGIAACWYPVHALGYNFLKSNGECAKVIAERIRGIVAGYCARGFDCKEIIVVTHSMGGLLGRALLHPNYGDLLDDKKVRVLGMYHSVMPTTGAAATYKRMRFGFQEGNAPFAEMKARLLGADGENATAILANAPGPLELLPSGSYGQGWLKLLDRSGGVLMSLPTTPQKALEEIYTQSQGHWWRLVNPKWINPAGIEEKNGGGLANVYKRIRNTEFFTHSISETFHPTASFGSFCESDKHKCYGEVIFKIVDKDVSREMLGWLPPSTSWQLVADDGKGTLRVQAGTRLLTLQLQNPSAPGDETVPARRSARRLKGMRFFHGGDAKGYEHQDSFSDKSVLASLLYSLVKIAKSADWGAT